MQMNQIIVRYIETIREITSSETNADDSKKETNTKAFVWLS